MKKTMLCVISGLLLTFSGFSANESQEQMVEKDYVRELANQDLNNLAKNIANTRVCLSIKEAVFSALQENPALKDNTKELVQIVSSKVTSRRVLSKGKLANDQSVGLGEWPSDTQMFCRNCNQYQMFTIQVNWWTREGKWVCKVCGNEYSGY